MQLSSAFFKKLLYLLNNSCKRLNPEVKLCLNFKLDGYHHFFTLDPQGGEDVADIKTFRGSFFGLVEDAEDEMRHR